MSGVVSIQGNLGAGKSTLLSLLSISVIKQPVDEWQNMIGGNILKNYYEDPKRWAFTFQLNALHSRNLLWSKTIKERPNQIHYSERSPLADRQIFGELMYREGNLDSAEYLIYDELCNQLMKDCPLKAIVYLRCPPQICLQRIKKRNRQGEDKLPLSYIKKVHERHEEWLGSLKNIPILTIDTGLYDVYSEKDQQEVANLISTFIQGLNRQDLERKDSKETQCSEFVGEMPKIQV